MVRQFSNVYWSLDYRSGIEGLSEQSIRSLNQLHELRKLVFGYLNYFNANSDYLNKVARDVSDPANPFKALSETKDNTNKRVISGTVAQNTESFGEALTQSSDDVPVEKEAKTYLLSDVLEEHRKEISLESRRLFYLTTLIDREVLEHISEMLKHFEPQIRSMLSGLEDLLEEYDKTSKTVEALKKEYFECLSLKEITDSKSPKREDGNKTPVSASNSFVEDESFVDDESENEAFDLEAEFDFPLQIGTLKLSDPKELSVVMKNLISSIPTTKRQIPIPGYKNEVFSSESLCQHLRSMRPLFFDPSRANIERFGQSLLDLQLMVGSGFIGTKKFKSEKMWFEWSDLGQYSSEYAQNPKNGQIRVVTPLTPTKISKLLMEDDKAKLMNNMAQNASQKVRGMFLTMKTSLKKGNTSEHLSELNEKYTSSYLKLQTIKHHLETRIFENCQTLDKFEKLKIQMIYQSLTKLHGLVYDSTLNSSKAFEKSAKKFIESINLPKNYQSEYDSMVEHFSTGIYSPSLVPPDLNSHMGSIQSNNSFQNIKASFNLYKDIPLQISFKDSGTEELLSLSSLPLFLHDLFRLIEHKSGESQDTDKASTLWLSPFNHSAHWTVKESLLKSLANFDHITEEDGSILQEDEITRKILGEIKISLSKLDLPAIVNFAKGWLLEVSDSIIPSTVFDSLMNIFKSDDEIEIKKKELVKLLSTVPRSNLSSLVFVLEHISDSFGLNMIPCYGLSDNFPEELKQVDPADKLKEYSVQLNSMDAIGSVPFLHLICRPSPLKIANGFKPPLDIYNDILNLLLDIDIRSTLFEALVKSEKNFRMKKDQEKSGLPVKKTRLSSQLNDLHVTKQNGSANLDSSLVKSPSYLNSESFSLRPFKTKATPNPSPSASPRPITALTPASSIDYLSGIDGKGRNMINSSRDSRDSRSRSSSASQMIPSIDPKIRNTSYTSKDSRSRSSSNSFLAPPIEIEFEKRK